MEPEDAGHPGEEQTEGPDALVVLTRVLYCGVLALSIVLTMDQLAGGDFVSLRALPWLRVHWARAVAPLRARSEFKKAAAWVVWEAMEVVGQ